MFGMIPKFTQICPTLGDSVYLNTGSCAPLCPSVYTAITEAYHQSLNPLSKPWIVHEEELSMIRAALANVIHAHRDEIVLTENATQGINFVLQGIDWNPGDEILTTMNEHVSVLLPCFSISERHGVKVKTIQNWGMTDKEIVKQFENAITERTRMIVLSHVTWNSGRILPVSDMCRLAKQHNISTLIDGAQGPGHVPVDVRKIDCDAYAISGHKWLFGPTGTGALFIRKSLLDKLWPLSPGYYSIRKFTLDGDFHWESNAQKLESSTHSVATFHGLKKSLQLIQSIGVNDILTEIQLKSKWFLEELLRIPGIRLVDNNGESHSGMLTCVVENIDYEELAEYCASRGVYFRTVERPRGIRFSIHAFHTVEQLEYALQVFQDGMFRNRGSESQLVVNGWFRE